MKTVMDAVNKSTKELKVMDIDCPKLGDSFMVGYVEDDSRIIDFKGLEVEVIGLSVGIRHNQVITFQHPLIGIGCGVLHDSWVKPIDTRTDKEKAADEFIKDMTDSDFIKEQFKKTFLAGAEWAGE
jgi:hypothetical protein